MIYLLDTNAVSDLVWENPKIQERLARLAPSDRAITCVIVRGEILYGIERLPPGRRRDDLERKATRILAAIDCESVPALAASNYAQVKWARSQKGLSLDENDLWIVAVALAIGAVLVSRDTNVHQINGLSVEDWTC